MICSVQCVPPAFLLVFRALHSFSVVYTLENCYCLQKLLISLIFFLALKLLIFFTYIHIHKFIIDVYYLYTACGIYATSSSTRTTLSRKRKRPKVVTTNLHRNPLPPPLSQVRFSKYVSPAIM